MYRMPLIYLSPLLYMHACGGLLHTYMHTYTTSSYSWLWLHGCCSDSFLTWAAALKWQCQCTGRPQVCSWSTLSVAFPPEGSYYSNHLFPLAWSDGLASWVTLKCELIFFWAINLIRDFWTSNSSLEILISDHKGVYNMREILLSNGCGLSVVTFWWALGM
jgi:hypothetical protein